MSHAIRARMAEAAAQWVQQQVYGAHHCLRLAVGYAACPDHSLKRLIFDRLDAEHRLPVTLNDHYSIQPSTSVCGLFIDHSEARYFSVGPIDRQQQADYSLRRKLKIEYYD